jgi:hypothetical protein
VIDFIQKIKSKLYEEKDLLWLISIGWILVSMLSVIISNEGIPHALRSILMIPAVFIISGIGAFNLISVTSRYLNPEILGVFILIILVGLTIQAYCPILHSLGKKPKCCQCF